MLLKARVVSFYCVSALITDSAKATKCRSSLSICFFMFALLQLLTLPRSVECVRIHLSEVQCARACEMIQNGQTQRQVAMTLGVS